eukprot:GHVS01048091.1.p1 GENE.GHVS01048091.1~~GHVS01048091.1.p1  ORF type:complete len:1000 (-),score=105.05 GHVS01048091.1:214-3213(-)
MKVDAEVGQDVVVFGRRAVVRFVGHVPERSQLLVGVEFTAKPIGNTNGTIHGKSLFTAGPRYGRFVRPDRVLPYEEKLAAAVVLQAYARGFLARRDMEEQIAFKFWNELENNEEKVALQENRDISSPVEKNIMKQIHDEELDAEMDSMDEDTYDEAVGRSRGFAKPGSFLEVPTAAGSKKEQPGGRRRSSHRRSLGRQSIDAASIAREEVDPGYTGPTLQSGPVIRQFGLDLIDHYRRNPTICLPRKFAFALLVQIEDMLRNHIKGAVIEVDIPKKADTRLVMVGDTHGQLNDVLWLFYKFGPPSSTNIYLFNGDIADRGAHAAEIFLLLFAFKLAHYDSVIINRGNHESADMNEVYGFAQEVRQKYGGLLYQKFQDVFHLLPLCVVLESRVLVVHGGLFRKDNVTLKHINTINRGRPCPATPNTYEDTLMFDILWSDPQPEPGRGFSTRGADCVSFGPDITNSFLNRNNLEVCIRSHQVPSNLRGFEPVHDGRCVTLFSASNYCGTTGNYGGVIIFEPDMSFEIQEYMAPSLEEIDELYRETQEATQKVISKARIKDMEYQARSRNRKAATNKMELDILNKIGKLVCEKKQELWWFLFNQDENNTGSITPAEWREACAAVLGEKLPWVFLMRKLQVVSPGNTVYYNDFLQRFRIDFRPAGFKHQNWRKETVKSVFESILAADLNLRETLMLFDRNCDGTVSYREFYEFLTELEIGLSEPQVKILMRIITSNHVAAGDPATRIDAAEFLGRFKVMYSTSTETEGLKDEWIKKALQCIGRMILSDKSEAARRHYESQEHGAGQERSSRRRSSAVRAVALFQKFKDYNDQGDGYLAYDCFVNAMKQLPLDQATDELGFELKAKHLLEIATAIDKTGSNKINYLEFLNAFHVVDNSSKSNIGEELWGHICATLFQHKGSIRRALHKFDSDLTGRVEVEDFRSGLTTLNSVLARTEAPLTEEQIESLVTCFDLDENGMVEYEEFLESFRVVLGPATDPEKPSS